MPNQISAESILEAARKGGELSSSSEKLEAAREALEWLKSTKAALDKALADGTDPHEVTDINNRSEAFKKFLFDTLGEGEIRISMEKGDIRMEETSVPMVWRMLIGNVDMVVTATVPDVVRTYSTRNEHETIVEPETKPEGIFAAPAILSQLRSLLAKIDDAAANPSGVPLSVELSRQPMSPADKAYIDKVLGKGSIEVQMKGFAKSTIVQTSVRGLWRSRILNNAGKELLDQIVVAALPPEIPSSTEDIPLAVRKLSDLIEWIELDLARGAI